MRIFYNVSSYFHQDLYDVALFHSWASASSPTPPASAFRHLSPVRDQSGTGLDSLILVLDCSFLYLTDRMPNSPAFRAFKNFYKGKEDTPWKSLLLAVMRDTPCTPHC